jgi:hypothetical protein
LSKLRNPNPIRLIRLIRVVQRFGWAVADPGQVVVADLVEPPLEGRAEFAELGGIVGRRQCSTSSVSIARAVVFSVELAQPFLDPVGDRDFGVRVAEREQ